jgi:multisubunit Na+/H+ antiporter MnhC subunit
MNPFDGLAKYLLGRLEQKIIQDWARFLFQMAFSALVSFLFTCGTVLVSSKSVIVAVGSAMVMSAIVLTVFFRTSKLTAGMQVVLPSEEAEQEIAAGIQTITKPEEKKP